MEAMGAPFCMAERRWGGIILRWSVSFYPSSLMRSWLDVFLMSLKAKDSSRHYHCQGQRAPPF